MEGKLEEPRTTAKNLFPHYKIHPTIPPAKLNNNIAPDDSYPRSTPITQTPPYLDPSPNMESPQFHTHKKVAKVEVDQKGTHTHPDRE